jgi:hypothetical protein
MKNSYKAALLAALGIAVISTAQAQNYDLSLGFNDLAGPTSAQNDYVIDLGSIANFNVNYSQSWTFSGTTFSSQYSTDANWMSDVAAGVIGASGTTLNPKEFMETGLFLPHSQSSSQFGNATAISTGVTPGTSPSASGDWSGYVAQDPTTAGNASSGALLTASASNPLSLLSSGVVTENLYEDVSTGTSHTFTEIGTFTINANTDTVTFTGADATSVPEPTTYGLLAGAGLLLVGVRRQFAKKNA